MFVSVSGLCCSLTSLSTFLSCRDRTTASLELTYGETEMCTEHQMVPVGLPKNHAANLHGIAVASVRLKSTNATWQKKFSCIAANYKNTMYKTTCMYE